MQGPVLSESALFVQAYNRAGYHMYSERQAWANSEDLDAMPNNAASQQGFILCIQQFSSGSKLYLFKL